MKWDTAADRRRGAFVYIMSLGVGIWIGWIVARVVYGV